ncbi:MAG: hypothetical protein V2A73_10670 [Pseudomonadota bacterium]
MGNQPWLSRVRERLAKHVLPPSYVQRFVEELTDHLEDLKEENVEADAISRLGEPEQVANAAVAAYRRRSFLGRHPVAAFLVFAVSPVIPQYVLGGVLWLVLAIFTGNYQYEEHDLALSLTVIVCSTFVGILYGELAMRLGIGRKWMLTSFAVMGVMAMFWEHGLNHGTGLHTVRVLVQFATPLAVGGWFAKRKYNHGYPATTFFIFAISPVISLMLLWLILSWLILATMYVIPTALASLLYCHLTKGFGSGRKWMFVSCTVLATFAAMGSFRLTIHGSENSAGLPIGLTTCIILAQFLIPLAIGWWFMRHKHDQGELQPAS